MRILLVAATDPEVGPLLDQLQPRPAAAPRTSTCRRASHDVDILITGVGMVATAVWVSRALMTAQYDLALNAGICGAFDPHLSPGTVVHVASDRIAELGAEDGDRFLTIHELQLLGENEFPFSGGVLTSVDPPGNAVIRGLPAVTGITVNTVHGREASIAAVRERWQPQVESMEGAAFMYACRVAGVPCAQVRAVSNVVERRRRAAWQLPEAIGALCRTTLAILDQP